MQISKHVDDHNQARSQDLKKGGAILKEWEVCIRRWLEFSLTLNQFQTVCQCLGNVSESSEIQRFFPPKIRWSPKKKKKKKKKKKGLRQNSEWFARDILKHGSPKFRKFKRLRGGSFRMGGLFSIFHRKSASKAQNTCVFAYFTSQWGGLEPPPASPPPGYATDHNTIGIAQVSIRDWFRPCSRDSSGGRTTRKPN